MNYNVFSVIRNPYNRILSSFNYLKKIDERWNRGDVDEWINLGSPSCISEFISNIYNKHKNNELSQINGLNQHIQQQYKFLVNNITEKKILCNLLKYENLHEDFKEFIEIYKQDNKVYNLLYNNIYKNIKIKKNYDINNILSSNDIKLINEIYDEDFLLFGYNKISI